MHAMLVLMHVLGVVVWKLLPILQLLLGCRVKVLQLIIAHLYVSVGHVVVHRRALGIRLVL